MLYFCDFIQVYVLTTNHHLKDLCNKLSSGNKTGQYTADFHAGATKTPFAL